VLRHEETVVGTDGKSDEMKTIKSKKTTVDVTLNYI